jgi:hypothetical protein
MASAIYNSFKAHIMDGTIDLSTDAIYVMLVTDYTVDIDAHEMRDDVTSYEVSGTGYTAAGAAITTLTVSIDDTDNEGVWDGTDVTWASSTIAAEGAIIYQSSGASTTDELIAYIDFGESKASSNGNFTISWSSEGIINLT